MVVYKNNPATVGTSLDAANFALSFRCSEFTIKDDAVLQVDCKQAFSVEFIPVKNIDPDRMHLHVPAITPKKPAPILLG